MRSHYGVTCHLIVDFTLCSFMLACSRFHGLHNAEHIYEQFERIKTNFEITNKISFIITDNASNMIKPFSLPGFGKESCPTFEPSLYNI